MSAPEMRQLALRAAMSAAAVVGDAVSDGGVPGVVAERKGHGDYVSEVDRRAEAAALAVLAEGAPGIPVLAEESAADRALPAGRVWAVDPLDGTTNFLRGYPIVGVSVALVEDGVPLAAAVCAPLLGRSWTAARGEGASDDRGRPLAVRPDDGGGVGSTGFPFRRPENLDRYLAVFEPALHLSEDLRRAGAACLDLAYAAQGSFDGFFELGLAPWDVAAGALLVTEAGGVVTDWEGDDRAWLRSGDIIAGAPRWHARMLALARGRRRAVAVAR